MATTMACPHSNDFIVQVGSIVRAPRRRLLRRLTAAGDNDDGVSRAILFTGRAIVLSIDDEGGSIEVGSRLSAAKTASLLFEDAAPQRLCLRRRPNPSLSSENDEGYDEEEEEGKRRNAKKNVASGMSLNRTYLVTPNFFSVKRNSDKKEDDDDEYEEEEGEALVSCLMPLLPFEEANESPSPSPSEWKRRGDALLRLKDYASAAAYYEEALALTSRLSVGADIVLKKAGRPVVAEVDCVDLAEDGSVEGIDVTFVPTLEGAGEDEHEEQEGEEGTVRESDVLLCLSTDDYHDDDGGGGVGGEGAEEAFVPSLQERILLNLSRCLLRLAEIDVAGKRALHRPAMYRRAAVLGCTLSLTRASRRRRRYWQKQRHSRRGQSCTNDGGTCQVLCNSNPTHPFGEAEKSALLLRASAFSGLFDKSKHAAADLQKVLRYEPNCAEAKRALRLLEANDARRRKADKMLAKEMCRWVQRATNTAAGGDQEVSVPEESVDCGRQEEDEEEMDDVGLGGRGEVLGRWEASSRLKREASKDSRSMERAILDSRNLPCVSLLLYIVVPIAAAIGIRWFTQH